MDRPSTKFIISSPISFGLLTVIMAFFTNSGIIPTFERLSNFAGRFACIPARCSLSQLRAGSLANFTFDEISAQMCALVGSVSILLVVIGKHGCTLAQFVHFLW